MLPIDYLISSNGLIQAKRFLGLKSAWEPFNLWNIFTSEGFVKVKHLQEISSEYWFKIETESGRVGHFPIGTKFFDLASSPVKIQDLVPSDAIMIGFGGHSHVKESWFYFGDRDILFSHDFAVGLADIYKQKLDNQTFSQALLQCFGLLNSESLQAIFAQLFKEHNSFVCAPEHQDFFLYLTSAVGIMTKKTENGLSRLSDNISSEASFFFDRIKSIISIEMQQGYKLDLMLPAKFYLVNSFVIGV